MLEVEAEHEDTSSVVQSGFEAMRELKPEPACHQRVLIAKL